MPNGFLNFVSFKKRSNPEWKNKDLQELIPLCDPLWKNLGDIEKKKFQRKDAFKPLSGVDSYGRNLKDVQRNNEIQKNDASHMVTKIRTYFDNMKIEDTVFSVIHTNWFAKTDSGTYIPAEICLAVFSIREGLLETYHEFPDPHPIPAGYKYECVCTSERTHKIPLDLAMFNPNYHTICSELQRIIDMYRPDNKNVLLFTLNNMRSQIEGVLTRIYQKGARCRGLVDQTPEDSQFQYEVLDISILLQTIINTVTMNQGPNSSIQHWLLERKLNNENFVWDKIGCDFHASDGRYCSKAVVCSWIFNFCAEVCPLLKLDLIEGKHYPMADEDVIDSDIDDKNSVFSEESLFAGDTTDGLSYDSDLSDIGRIEYRNKRSRYMELAKRRVNEVCGEGYTSSQWANHVKNQEFSRFKEESFETDSVSDCGSSYGLRNLLAKLKVKNDATDVREEIALSANETTSISEVDQSFDSSICSSQPTTSSINDSFATADSLPMSETQYSFRLRDYFMNSRMFKK